MGPIAVASLAGAFRAPASSSTSRSSVDRKDDLPQPRKLVTCPSNGEKNLACTSHDSNSFPSLASPECCALSLL